MSWCPNQNSPSPGFPFGDFLWGGGGGGAPLPPPMPPHGCGALPFKGGGILAKQRVKIAKKIPGGGHAGFTNFDGGGQWGGKPGNLDDAPPPPAGENPSPNDDRGHQWLSKGKTYNLNVPGVFYIVTCTVIDTLT